MSEVDGIRTDCEQLGDAAASAHEDLAMSSCGIAQRDVQPFVFSIDSDGCVVLRNLERDAIAAFTRIKLYRPGEEEVSSIDSRTITCLIFASHELIGVEIKRQPGSNSWPFLLLGLRLIEVLASHTRAFNAHSG